MTITAISQRVRLLLAITALPLTIHAHAMLPVPPSLVGMDEETPILIADTPADNKHYASGPAAQPYQSILEQNTADQSALNQSAPDQSIKNTQSGHFNSAEQLLATWRQKVSADNLAQHTTWRRLLYFYDDKKSIFGKKKSTSVVNDPRFFLSDKGRQDSGAELDAMLLVLAQHITADGDFARTHGSGYQESNAALCRFPARVHWLAQVLEIDATRLSADCPDFDTWMSTLAPEQLSIMFAQEYLDNPMSAFAHTLLRIDSKASAADPSQIHKAYALNYTVGGDPNDSFVIYAIKSMIGRYDNAIDIDPYPQKWAKYLQDDERDTWTYQLDLTPAEVQQIMRHVWETKDLKMPYYFTTDNCASEILRLIDVVRPQQHLLSQLPYAVIPSDVIQLLNKKSLLANAAYTPADSTIRQAQLNTVQRDTIPQSRQSLDTKSMTHSVNTIKSAQLNPVSSLSADTQTLLSYPITAADNNPLDRQALQSGYVAVGQRGDAHYIDLGLRAGYHDTLDSPSGFPQFFDLEGAAATLRVYGDETDTDKDIVLQHLTLVRGRSFNPVNATKKGKTWGTSIEATRVNDGSQQGGKDHLVASLGYETGWSWAFGAPSSGTGEIPPQLCYTFLSGQGQAGRGINKGFRIGAGVNAGCLYQINNRLRAQAELQLPYWYHGSSADADIYGHYWQPVSTIGLQYDVDKKQAVRLSGRYDWQKRVDANDDVQLSYRRYF